MEDQVRQRGLYTVEKDGTRDTLVGSYEEAMVRS